MLVASHTRAVPSFDAVTMRALSGLHAALLTRSLWPARTARSSLACSARSSLELIKVRAEEVTAWVGRKEVKIALSCGYPISSLRERVYAIRGELSSPDRFGILIYTASAGAQGTLGGLTQFARRITELIQAVLDRLRLCSNDPVCAEHDPSIAARASVPHQRPSAQGLCDERERLSRGAAPRPGAAVSGEGMRRGKRKVLVAVLLAHGKVGRDETRPAWNGRSGRVLAALLNAVL